MAFAHSHALKVFLGACTFIAACLISCLCPTRHLAQVLSPAVLTRHFVTCSRRHWPPSPCKRCAGPAGRGPGLRGGGSGVELGGFALVCFCSLARFARLVLLAAGLLACSALCCASAWFILVTNEAPLLVRVCAGRGQPLCPWDRGDKVVSSCWWVRACFIHPETLFQTLSQVISRRIRPRLAPRTPFNNNPAGAVFHRLL